jgi:hypothetical protein
VRVLTFAGKRAGLRQFGRGNKQGDNMEITKQERELLRHALGLDYQTEPFRNHFVSGTRCDNFKDLEKLVELGLMTKRKDPFDEVNQSFVFHVTEKGKKVVSAK